jgi:hypothetical protein
VKLQVLEGLSQGKSNKDIARDLDLQDTNDQAACENTLSPNWRGNPNTGGPDCERTRGFSRPPSDKSCDKAVSDLHDPPFFSWNALGLGIISNFIQMLHLLICHPNGGQATLLDRFWKLIEAGQEPVIGQNGITIRRPPHRLEASFHCETGGHIGETTTVFAELPKVGWPASV